MVDILTLWGSFPGEKESGKGIQGRPLCWDNIWAEMWMKREARLGEVAGKCVLGRRSKQSAVVLSRNKDAYLGVWVAAFPLRGES